MGGQTEDDVAAIASHHRYQYCRDLGQPALQHKDERKACEPDRDRGGNRLAAASP